MKDTNWNGPAWLGPGVFHVQQIRKPSNDLLSPLNFRDLDHEPGYSAGITSNHLVSFVPNLNLRHSVVPK